MSFANHLILKIDSLGDADKKKKAVLKKRLNQLIESSSKQLLTLQGNLLIEGNKKLLK